MPRHDFAGAPLEGGVPTMISQLRYLRPSAPFRSTFQYNNMMYETISHLPKRLLNVSFECFVNQHIFKPLGMNASTYSVEEAEARRYPPDYIFSDSLDARTISANHATESIPVMAEGHQYSLRDFYLKERVPQTNLTLIPPEVLNRLETGVMVTEGKAAYPEFSPKVYGPAQWRYAYRGHEIIEHGGNNPGFKTQIARLPNLVGKIPLFPNATGLGIAVFSNDADGGPVLEGVKFRIIDDLLRLEEIDWYSRFVNDTEVYYAMKRRMAIPRPQDPQPPPRPISTLQDYSFEHPATPLRLKPMTFFEGENHRLTECNHIPTLVIPFHRTFATHLRLTHWSGPWFNLTVVWGNHGEHESKDEKNRILIGLDERFEVEWVTYEEEEGLAFRGGIWGMEGPDATAPKERGKKGAEVWFAKV
ncbi:hypothetical protein J132_06634 [Termitomyces sp. J132]|nr:hypothetical protein J132_06634 [Termitomyces sp. J132]